MSWPFPPYEKIASRLEEWLGDDEPAFRALRGVEWVATEKIHGANFVLATDGRDVRYAKRREWLAPEDGFFGCRPLADRLADGVRALGGAFPRALVYVYGELYGGGYPHPDVPPVPGVEPVQTGVWYAPDLGFCAFDVGLLRTATEARVYLPFDEAADHLARVGLVHTPVLTRGPHAHVAALPVTFGTTWPARSGLPPLDDNLAEGLVLKPVHSVTVRGRPGELRPVLKRKHPRFAEDQRYHAAVAPTRAPAGVVAALCAEASDRVCEPRIAAAASKVGRVDPSTAAEVAALAVDDVMDELILDRLSAADRETVRRHLQGEVQALMELLHPELSRR